MMSCADLARSLRFYRDLLGGVGTYGFPPEAEPAFVALSVGESSAIGLGGIAAEPFHRRPQRLATGDRVELCVYVHDVDARLAQARARGFEVVACRRTCRGASGGLDRRPGRQPGHARAVARRRHR